MIDLNRFNELKRKAEQEERDQARAMGARDQLLKDLEEKFGFKSLEQAEAALKKEKEALLKKKERFDKDLKSFEEDFPDDA